MPKEKKKSTIVLQKINLITSECVFIFCSMNGREVKKPIIIISDDMVHGAVAAAVARQILSPVLIYYNLSTSQTWIQ